MAHYAFIDQNNIVVEVITGRNEDEIVDGISNWESHYEQFRTGLKCIRTSYNNNIRKNYAGIGDTYDVIRDAFIAPKPFNSWLLDEETCRWQAPVPYPVDGIFYIWNEEVGNWVTIE
jgi:hypothetical protein